MQFATRTVHLPRVAGGLDFEVLADDAIIGPAIEQGSWAGDEVALMLAHIEPGSRVVDLGANVGWFAVQAVLAGAQVDAFEPVPAIAEIAQRNIDRAAAKSQGSGTVHPVAAGAEPGSAEIVLAAKNHGDNRVVESDDRTPGDLDGSERLTIQIAPVDSLVKGPVRFLKVDTQGSEWLALQGCTQLLDDSPELALLLEFWPYALRDATPDQLIDFLIAQGFTLGKATDGPFPMNRDRILRHAGHRGDVHGGIDLYGVRERPFHVLGTTARVRGLVRSLKEP